MSKIQQFQLDLGGAEFLLDAGPASLLGAATKQYVDTEIGNINTLGGITAQSLTTNGYVAFDSSIIIQWGRQGSTGAALTAGNRTVTFPISFPTNCFAVIIAATSTFSGATAATYMSVHSWTNTNWTTIDYAQGYTWLAIGH